MPQSGQSWVSNPDLQSPLFAPLWPITERLCRRNDWPAPDDYTALVARIREERGLSLPALRFAPQSKKPRRAKRGPVELDQLYDGSIALRGEVPCLTESYHDLFNAVIFAAFPLAKQALHARQFRALRERVTPGVTRLPEARTREQDALTVFDEGGSVVVVSREFAERWPADNQPTLLDDGSTQARLWIFGHALLEHILYGKYQLRSCAVVLTTDDEMPADILPWIDERLEARLEDPSRFMVPGADGVVTIDEQGRTWLERSLPS